MSQLIDFELGKVQLASVNKQNDKRLRKKIKKLNKLKQPKKSE